MENYDIVIKNAKIIDGTGNQFYKSDVGILNGKIKSIGKIDENQGVKLIEAEGNILSPGFIDIHAHSDLYVFYDNSMYSKLTQGITTEVSGNCGLSAAPVSKRFFSEKVRYFQGVNMGIQPPNNWSEFTSFDIYLKELERLKLGINMGFLVGQGDIRIAVMGFENRKATNYEMDKMKELVSEAMRSGVIGMSTGLIYPPGVFTPKDEIIELCKIVAEYGGIYTTHIRNESSYVIDAVKEAVEIGRQAEIPVLISHHKIGGKNNLGKSIDTLKLIDEANKEGIEVSLDQYPYSASCTYLSIHIPPEYHEGGNERLIQRLKNKNTLDNIKKRMLNENGAWENPAKLIGFENVLIIAADKTPEIVGKTIGDFAKKHNLDPYEVMFKVLVDNDANVLAANFGFNEEDIENIMRYPYTMIGTDGILAGEGKIIHPRATATFPRVLGRYVRERGVIRLEEAIRKMTSLPAQKARLKNKGLIKEGFDADLVIFDPDQIIDTATYTDPYSKNIGIKYVIVNGVISMIDNEFTGSSAGKVIRLKR